MVFLIESLMNSPRSLHQKKGTFSSNTKVLQFAHENLGLVSYRLRKQPSECIRDSGKEATPGLELTPEVKYLAPLA